MEILWAGKTASNKYERFRESCSILKKNAYINVFGIYFWSGLTKDEL